MILEKIKNEINEFEKESIQVVPGFDFNQKDTIETIYRLYNSKFKDGEYDDQGDKKYFYNIVRVPCNVGTKAIDFDTKDIRILTAAGNERKTWFFERDLKFWMKAQGFGKVLNRLFFELPIFGSVVLKIIDGKPYFVDLRNFVVDAGADTLDKANYIIEVHNYTPIEFRKIAEERKWKDYEEVIQSFRKSKEPYIKVYERYGELEDEAGFSFKRIIIADIGVKETEFILDEKGIKKHPYWEFHWEKIPGRWLGIGRVEILSDNQVRTNEISNQQAKSSYWSTLRIWQSRDEGINRNLLTDVLPGEILNVESEITQIDMADRNLAYYNQEIQRWLTNRDEMTFAYDVLRGERLPSGTPLGSAQIAAGMAGSYFDQIRENVAMDIKELFYKVIIPRFFKENSKEHTLRIAGEDLEEINEMLIDYHTQKEAFALIERTNHYPTTQEKELLKSVMAERIRKKKEQLIPVPKDFYKDIKYDIDIEITGEAIDVRIKAANLWIAIQAVTADPTLLTDPIKRKFFGKYLEMGGISPVEMGLTTLTPPIGETIRGIIPPGRAGGGISRPVVPTAPVAGPTEAII